MNNSKKFMLIGFVALMVLNPLSVNLWADFLIVAINFGAEQLIIGSSYTMAVAGTLIVVGGFLLYDERSKKQTTKLKKLKEKKTSKPAEYLL
jgi:hypothetical protein